jgi:hypothetical protein
LLVEGSVQPGGHHADVECGIAEAEGRASPVDVLRRAVKRLDQHLPGRSPQRHHSFEQLVDQPHPATSSTDGQVTCDAISSGGRSDDFPRAAMS